MEVIKPIRKNIIIDNSEKLVKEFWIKQSGKDIKDIDLFLTHSQIRETIKLIVRRTIYIQTNKELDYEFIELLDYLWSKGINIYLLTNKLYTSYKDTIVGKVLIRYSDNIIGDLILIDGNTTQSKGWISEESEFYKDKKYFQLSNSQLSECFEMFVYKFWKKTDFECIDEQTFISPIETKEAPFDIFPKLNSKNIISDDYLDENIINKLELYINTATTNITIITNNVNITDTILQKVAEREDSIKVEIIANIARGLQETVSLFYPIEDYDIYATNSKVYPMLILDNSVAVIFTNEVKGKSLLNSFCLINNDIDSLDKIIKYKNGLIFNENTYRYLHEMPLKEITSSSIINDINNINESTREISNFYEIEEENEECESLIDLYNGITKKKITSNNGYAKKIKYSYDLVPKYRNEAWKEDKIYDIWKNTYDNLLKYAEQLAKEIEMVLEENSGLISNIISFFNNDRINSKKTIRELEKIIIEVSKRNYSIDKLQSFDNSLKSIYDEYLKLNYDILEMKEYKEQSEKWKLKKLELEDNIRKLDYSINLKREEIKVKKDSLLNKKLIELEENIIIKKRETQEMKGNMINESETLREYFKKIDLVNSIGELLQVTKLKRKKDSDNIIERTKEIVNSIFNDDNYFGNFYEKRVSNAKNSASLISLIKGTILLEVNDFIIKDLSQVDKIALETLENLKNEIDILNERIEEEKKHINLGEINKKIALLQKEISSLEKQRSTVNVQLQQLGKEFEYKPSNKEIKSLKIKRFELKSIGEELPKVGVLYSNKGVKQLAIKYWDYLDLGISEAKRLNAELVCEI